MKFKLFTFALLGLLIASCTREALPEIEKEGGKMVTISATIPAETRVAYTDSDTPGSGGTLAWESGDQLMLVGYDNDNVYKGHKVFSYVTGTVGDFTGETVSGATKYKAYYPANVILGQNGEPLPPDANFWEQTQIGNGSSAHLAAKLLLSDTEANDINTLFTLDSPCSIIKFVLSNIPEDVGELSKLIWTVETASGTQSMTLNLNNVTIGTGATDLTAFLSFNPTVMQIKPNGEVNITLMGAKMCQWNTLVVNPKTYSAKYRYTATVNSDWTTETKTQFRYKITTLQPNTEYKIWQKSSSSINPVNLMIDWGDDSDTTIVQGASLLKTIASHEYAVADEYTITIYSDQVDTTLIQTPQIIFFNDDTYERDTLQTAILDPFPNMGTDFSYYFWGCIRLTSVPADLFRYNPSAIAFQRSFLSCIKLTSIPAELFKYNTQAVDFMDCFAGCAELNFIPAELFKYNINAKWLIGCFSFCYGITNIPEDLFKYNTLITDFSNCFWRTGLTSIPGKLFMYNTNALSFSSCFSECPGLSSIPAELFQYNTKATDFSYCFNGCTGLSSIPDYLFRYNLEVKYFNACFSGCTGLTKIPQILFIKNQKAITFNSCFQNCTGLTKIPIVIFDLNLQAEDFKSCFEGCTGLSSIPTGLFEYNTKAINFSKCFSGCTRLRLIAEIFPDPSTNPDFFVGRTMDFSNCFYNVGTQAAYPGTAPRLWEFTGNSGWTITNCFTNAFVSNYGDIPPSWKGL